MGVFSAGAGLLAGGVSKLFSGAITRIRANRASKTPTGIGAAAGSFGIEPEKTGFVPPQRGGAQDATGQQPPSGAARGGLTLQSIMADPMGFAKKYWWALLAAFFLLGGSIAGFNPLKPKKRAPARRRAPAPAARRRAPARKRAPAKRRR